MNYLNSPYFFPVLRSYEDLLNGNQEESQCSSGSVHTAPSDYEQSHPFCNIAALIHESMMAHFYCARGTGRWSTNDKVAQVESSTKLFSEGHDFVDSFAAACYVLR